MKPIVVKIINVLFILLIITSTLTYGIQAIKLVMDKQYILWTMADNNIQTGIIGKIFPYLKDIIAVLLFIILFLFFKKSRKTAIIFLLITIYGTLILLCNQSFEIGYVISGIRMFLYFFVAIMYFQVCTEKKKIFEILFKVLKSLIIIEFLIVFVQVIYSGQINNFGNGGYRFCGTFGNATGMSNFTVAVNLFIIGYNYVTDKRIKFTNYIFLFMNLLLSIASGTRTGIFLNLLIIYMYWSNFSLKKVKLSKNIKFLFIFIIAICALPFIYNFFIDRIGRGALMDSGGTRIEIFFRFFNVNNWLDLFNLFIGNGIGFGTNIAKLLELNSSRILDGTYTTILAQFGLLGLVVFLFLLIKLIKLFWKYINKNLNVMTSYFVTIILLMYSQNIFEQIVMIALIVVTYFMIKEKYINDKEREMINDNIN